jgi:hypothetical protein
LSLLSICWCSRVTVALPLASFGASNHYFDNEGAWGFSVLVLLRNICQRLSLA